MNVDAHPEAAISGIAAAVDEPARARLSNCAANRAQNKSGTK
jgi:hypothetical protein